LTIDVADAALGDHRAVTRRCATARVREAAEFEAYIPVLAGDLLSLRRCAFLERLATPSSHPHGATGIGITVSWRPMPHYLRAAVTACARLPMEGPAHASSRPAQAPTREVTETSRSPSTYWWAMWLARIYEVFPLRCPRCGKPMRIIAFVTDSGSITRILAYLGEPTKAPYIAPAARSSLGKGLRTPPRH